MARTTTFVGRGVKKSVNQQEEERRQALVELFNLQTERQEQEDARRNSPEELEWRQRKDAMYDEKFEGVIQPTGEYKLVMQQNQSRSKGDVSMFVLMIVVGERDVDNEPYRDLAYDGDKGLKIFLNGPSKEIIGQIFPDQYNAALANKYDFEENGYYKTSVIVSDALDVAILGYSKNGMTAYGKLILGDAPIVQDDEAAPQEPNAKPVPEEVAV
jgi:hypothetical protein